jgi:hypothetical protein
VRVFKYLCLVVAVAAGLYGFGSLALVIGAQVFADGYETVSSLPLSPGLTGVAFVATFAGAIAYAAARGAEFNRRWTTGLRRGTAVLSELRPGNASSEGARQSLTCFLDVRLPGVQSFTGHYRARIRPLDVPRLVEGATFECEANPDVPLRVRAYLHAPPAPAPDPATYVDFRQDGATASVR